jgi:hypothetical protein
MKALTQILSLICILTLTACGDDPSKPYLKIVGGGFTNFVVQNIVTYSVAVKRIKALPAGSIIEATFDLPDSDRKYVTTEPADPPKLGYLFESEPLHGLKKGQELTVHLRLLQSAGGTVLAEFEKTFHSDADQ